MTILVTGATGTVGRHLVGQLVHGGHEVRAMTRDPLRAKLPEGVQVVAGDLTRPETLPAALDGVTAMHLITFGGEGYAPLENAEQVLGLIKKAGVRRVTVLTGFEPGPVEAAAENSGLEWTHLQPVEFMSNMLEWAPSVREDRPVSLPFAHCPSAMVHEADIAAVAAAALLEDGHDGSAYTITGPQSLTPVETARLLSEALGRPLKTIEVGVEEARRELRESGLAEDEVEALVRLGTNPPERARTVLPTVEQVTGRPARTFAQWAAEHVDAFR
ncbi:Uncharacterized conserved protein YbjT, contains NAD(P)-binding and DUF2867 domains [Amycolatopsis lurida]|uniref:Hydroxylase n=1 Tax=Amycolatopsis lurida NRRL 2430 TaxID=1460371 RepID=A0A2P2FW21_AMYLU|nr:NAD(P)H-binding protein [Amycolatopsis lurida]KFU80941.1 hydroxylase [Amycolatopsis lurida NRRL 2430]SED90578.1 Uncharacterized conserved protein YbjT, contains NAD(P)-binding and DUF2867 domains [Amycolatopsis lurida]